MSEKSQMARKSEGGMIWLAALVSIGALWGTSLGIWPMLVLDWVVVSMAFTLVRWKQRYISGQEAIAVMAFVSLSAAIVWSIGHYMNKCAIDAVVYSANEPGNTIMLAVTIAICVLVWQLSAVLVSAAAESDNSITRMFSNAWHRVVSDAPAWGMSLITVMLHSALSLRFAFADMRVLQILLGILMVIVQIRLLHALNGGDGQCSRRAATNRTRAAYINAVWTIGAFLVGFFLFLQADGGIDRSRFIAYPFGWIFGTSLGIVVTIAAWLIGLTGRIKIIVILGLIVVNIFGLVVFFVEGPNQFLQFPAIE